MLIFALITEKKNDFLDVQAEFLVEKSKPTQTESET